MSAVRSANKGIDWADLMYLTIPFPNLGGGLILLGPTLRDCLGVNWPLLSNWECNYPSCSSSRALRLRSGPSSAGA